MPSVIDQRLYYRVSDLIPECAEQIYHRNLQMVELQLALDNNQPTFIKGIISIEAIRGTWVHHLIENEINKFMDMPMVEQKWTAPEQVLFDRYTDPKNTRIYREFREKVASSMSNFYKWWKFFEPQDAIPEQRILFEVPSLSYPVKGTVDFISSIEQRKLDYALTGTMGTSTERNTMVIDWKSGKSGKPMQICAYMYGLKQNQIWQEITEDHTPYTFANKTKKDKGRVYEYGAMLFLGGSHYDFNMIKYDPNPFLKRCEAHESMPRQPVNVSTGNMQTSPYVCKYCPFSDRCTIYSSAMVDISS